MKNKKYISLIIIGAIIIIIGLSANTILENKVRDFLQNKLPENIESSYGNISVNSLRGNIKIADISFLIKDKGTNFIRTKVRLNEFAIKDVGYLEYFLNKKININKILFDGANITHYKNNAKNPKKEPKKKTKTTNPIFIKTFEFKNTSVLVYENAKDSIFFSAKSIDLKVSDIQIDTTTTAKTFQKKYKSIVANASLIFMKAGEYENFTITHLDYKNNTALITGIGLKTKYGKKELSKIIKKERDHYLVSVKSLNINDIDYGFIDDSFYFKSSLLIIEDANAEIYRDKLVADDLKVKNLYSKSLRELPIKLTIDSVSAKNSKIVYLERDHAENPPGALTISKIKAGITNLSNTYSAPNKTTILADAILMDNTPVHANWDFDVNNKKDEFKFVGNVGKISGHSLNALLTPLLNVKVEGIIDHTSFTVTGNYLRSTIYMNQEYNNIKVAILNKHKKKNKIVSGIANIFVHKNSATKDDAYKTVTASATRDNTKSFFNYLARNLKAALFASFLKNKKKSRKKKETLKLAEIFNFFGNGFPSNH